MKRRRKNRNQEEHESRKAKPEEKEDRRSHEDTTQEAPNTQKALAQTRAPKKVCSQEGFSAFYLSLCQ